MISDHINFFRSGIKRIQDIFKNYEIFVIPYKVVWQISK